MRWKSSRRFHWSEGYGHWLLTAQPLKDIWMAKYHLPLIAVTLGDVAGIGPETIVRAALSPKVRKTCRLLAVGHPRVLEWAVELVGEQLNIIEVPDPGTKPIPPADSQQRLFCWNPCREDAADVPAGAVDARAGQAAYDALVAATRSALAGQVDAITTAPLSKAALHLAGHRDPGHTEILARECGVDKFAMMLYLPPDGNIGGEHGLGVAHATLHTSIHSVPKLLTTARVRETIDLVDHFMKRIGCESPRIGVCALNPHAGEQGLFGNEEAGIIRPAVESATKAGTKAFGPFPADTLLKRAAGGEFDGVAAMYHDQGHIALKLIAFDRVVNVTLGLPIVRTSPSHGTAFDIAWRGQANPAGMIAALQVAARLCK
jgi:4-phospho-D-threonate 3-dehydrogenase / 4-phospho-D-erythronate 3-dehydrogenase